MARAKRKTAKRTNGRDRARPTNAAAGSADGQGSAAPIPATATSAPEAPPQPGAEPLPLPRRERFALEYAACLNAAKAARRAGYAWSSANAEGARLLADVSVRQRVEWLKARAAERARFDLDELNQVLKAIVHADPLDLVKTPEGPEDQAYNADAVDTLMTGLHRFRPLHEVDADTRAAIREVKDEVSASGKQRRSYVLHDKVGAARLYAELNGALKQRVEHTGAGGGPIQTDQTLRTDEQVERQLNNLLGPVEARMEKDRKAKGAKRA